MRQLAYLEESSIGDVLHCGSEHVYVGATATVVEVQVPFSIQSSEQTDSTCFAAQLQLLRDVLTITGHDGHDVHTDLSVSPGDQQAQIRLPPLKGRLQFLKIGRAS